MWGTEVLTAADLNAEFDNILNNASALISPLGGALDWDGYAHTLDTAGVTTAQSTSSTAWSFTPGNKSGAPGTTGGIANFAASTWTDTNTAGSGTASAWTGHSFQRPTLAAANSSVTTTDAATVYIANSPLAGSNQTLTNAYALWVDAGNVRFDGTFNLTPTGSIQMYAGSAAPTGFLLCDGSAVSRTTYADLFAVLSTTYGVGDGATTFNVPDLRGRIPIGVGTGTGGGASGTGLPSGGSSLTAVSRGTWKGAETHTLAESEMPAHTHSNVGNVPVNNSAGGAQPIVQSSSGTSASTGGGGAHNNMQPVMGLNFIIKT